MAREWHFPFERALGEAGVVQHGQFRLASGKMTTVKAELSMLHSWPDQKSVIVGGMSFLVRPLIYDAMSGVSLTVSAFTSSLADRMSAAQIFVRSDKPDNKIEGYYREGHTILVIDDVITTGTSLMKDVVTLRRAGLKVTDAAVIVDREEGGREVLARNGIKLHSLTTLNRLISHG